MPFVAEEAPPGYSLGSLLVKISEIDMMAHRALRVILLALLALAAASRETPAVVVDDFSQGAAQATALGDSPRSFIDFTQEQLDADHTIGGFRRWSRFYHNAPPGGVDSSTTIRIDPLSETFSFASQGGDCTSCGYFDLTYGSVDSPLDADFLADGADRLRFRFAGSGGTPTISLRVWAPSTTTGNVIDVQSGIGRRNVVAPTGAIIELPFDQFNDSNGEPRVDLTRVERFALSVIRFPSGQQFEIDLIETAGPPLLGDLNRDGVVNADDYDAWSDGFGLERIDFSSGELVPHTFAYRGLSVDGNQDDFIDGADYAVLRDSLGAIGSTPASVLAIPESATGSLACLAAFVAGSTRRLRQEQRVN